LSERARFSGLPRGVCGVVTPGEIRGDEDVSDENPDAGRSAEARPALGNGIQISGRLIPEGLFKVSVDGGGA
jgi:hypothetical protein